MATLLVKLENAHEKSIWCCAFGQINVEVPGGKAVPSPKEIYEEKETDMDQDVELNKEANEKAEADKDKVEEVKDNEERAVGFVENSEMIETKEVMETTAAADEVDENVSKVDGEKVEMESETPDLNNDKNGEENKENAEPNDAKTEGSSQDDTMTEEMKKIRSIEAEIASAEAKFNSMNDDLAKSISINDEPVDLELVDCIVTGSLDDAIKVWILRDVELKLHKTFNGHSMGVISVALNEDCAICAASSLDSSLILWEMKTGNKLQRLMLGPFEMWTLCFSPDDKYVLCASERGKVNKFRVEDAVLEQTLSDTREKYVLSVACSKNGKFVASGAEDGIVTLYDAQTAKVSNTLEGHAMGVRALCFSPDCQNLLTGSEDGHLKLYKLEGEPKLVAALTRHESWVTSVDFSWDGRYIVSGSSDKTVKIWKVSMLTCVHTFKDHEDQVWGVRYSRNEEEDVYKIVSVSEDQCVIVYEHGDIEVEPDSDDLLVKELSGFSGGEAIVKTSRSGHIEDNFGKEEGHSRRIEHDNRNTAWAW